MPATALKIAIAVVEHEGRYLIGRRADDVPLAGLWEFPGGKVHDGETMAEAAARECLEETGLAVHVEERYLVARHAYDHGRLELHFFRCTPVDPGQPPRAPFRWVPGSELPGYRFPDANAPLIRRLAGEG